MEAQSQCNCRLGRKSAPDTSFRFEVERCMFINTSASRGEKTKLKLDAWRARLQSYTAAIIESSMWNSRGVKSITKAALTVKLDEVRQQLKRLLPYKPAMRWPILEISLSGRARPCRTCEHRLLAIAGVAFDDTEKRSMQCWILRHLVLKVLSKPIYDSLTSECLQFDFIQIWQK